MNTVPRILSPQETLPACDARIAGLHRYWLSIHPAPHLLPGRQHFDPAQVPHLLSWIWLIDIHRNPFRFKYRLVGTKHVEASGWDSTGKWLDEAHLRFTASSAYSHFSIVTEQGQLGFYRGPPVYVINKDYISIERLVMPLASDGKDVDMLLGITILNPRTPAVR